MVRGAQVHHHESLSKLGIKPADDLDYAASPAAAGVCLEMRRVAKQTLVGYRARRDIRDRRSGDLDQLGDLILRATDAGVNQINPPVLESSKAESPGRREALATAARLLREIKAETLAKSLGVKLGNARIVRESGGNAPPMMVKARWRCAGAEAFDSGNQQMGMSTGRFASLRTCRWSSISSPVPRERSD